MNKKQPRKSTSAHENEITEQIHKMREKDVSQGTKPPSEQDATSNIATKPNADNCTNEDETYDYE